MAKSIREQVYDHVLRNAKTEFLEEEQKYKKSIKFEGVKYFAVDVTPVKAEYQLASVLSMSLTIQELFIKSKT